MIPGETILSGAPASCDHDGQGEPTPMRFEVLGSGGGWYVGTECPCCGPYSRETGYMTKPEAEAALQRYAATGVLDCARR